MQDSCEPHIYWTRFTVKVHLLLTVFYFQKKRRKKNETIKLNWKRRKVGNFPVPFVNQPLPLVFVADSITCIRQRPNSSMIIRSWMTCICRVRSASSACAIKHAQVASATSRVINVYGNLQHTKCMILESFLESYLFSRKVNKPVNVLARNDFHGNKW